LTPSLLLDRKIKKEGKNVKKFISVIAACTLVFSLVGGDFADAGKRSGSSSTKSSTKTTTTPKATTTPKTTTTTPKATTTPKTTTTTPKKTTTKKKAVVKASWLGSTFYRNGSFAPYLLTAAGAYLLYQGMEDDGDPIYTDAYSGEEIDDDDLEELDVTEVDTIPTKYVEKENTPGIVWAVIWVLAFLVFGLVFYNLYFRRKKQ
jgi:hypothetical protein